mgnify:CR=1 FL=1
MHALGSYTTAAPADDQHSIQPSTVCSTPSPLPSSLPIFFPPSCRLAAVPLTCLQVCKVTGLHPLAQRCIPVVLYGVVGAAGQVAGQHSPLVAYHCVQQHQLLVLLQ